MNADWDLLFDGMDIIGNVIDDFYELLLDGFRTHVSIKRGKIASQLCFYIESEREPTYIRKNKEVHG